MKDEWTNKIVIQQATANNSKLYISYYYRDISRPNMDRIIFEFRAGNFQGDVCDSHDDELASNNMKSISQWDKFKTIQSEIWWHYL